VGNARLAPGLALSVLGKETTSPAAVLDSVLTLATKYDADSSSSRADGGGSGGAFVLHGEVSLLDSHDQLMTITNR
jgi:hypothetical protein